MYSHIKSLTLALLACLCATIAHAGALKPAEIFGGSMVLQHGTPLPVWGDALPNTEVTVSFAGKVAKTKANGNGKWRVTIAPLAVSAKGRDFVITSGDEVLTYRNVLVGEVWLASGQSNMEWGLMAGVRDGAQIIAEGNHPGIRLFSVHKTARGRPQTSFGHFPWVLCSPETLKRGTHRSHSAVAYLFARELHQKLGVPVGIIVSAWGGTRIEPWTPAVGFQRPEIPNLRKLAASSGRDNMNREPSSLYNAMIAPLVPYAIRGAIWYQGESNLGELDYADKTFALVQGWRDTWAKASVFKIEKPLDFYFVQLAPFTYGGKSPELLPLSWEQQTKSLSIANTGMAIVNDVGNPRNIHPSDKTTVASRLARLALSRTYGKKFADDSGPLFDNAEFADNGSVTVHFKYAASGLKTRDGAAPTLFDVAGADGVFVPAVAEIKGSTVVLKAEKVSAPAFVRFAWDQNAVPNLTNGEDLPAGAFRAKKDPAAEFPKIAPPPPPPPKKPAAPAKAPAPAPAPAEKKK